MLFINKRVFKRLLKEVKKEQLNKTIKEIDYLNELQDHVLLSRDMGKGQNIQLDFIKKLDNAKRKNLQA